MSKFPEARNHRIVLHALALLTSKTPAISQAGILGDVATDAPCRARGPAAQGGTGRAQVNGIRAPAEDGRDRRVRRARILLNGRGYRDTLGDDQRHGVDSDGDGTASILHSWSDAAAIFER